MANATDKFTATQTVRSGGFFWLNPIGMSVVNCNRAEVVECACLKPCWSGAGWRYLLIVGRIRVPRTFAAGQRTRYEDHWEVSLPGLGHHHSCRSHATKTAFISSTTLRCLSIHLAVAPEISTSWYQYPFSLGFS